MPVVQKLSMIKYKNLIYPTHSKNFTMWKIYFGKHVISDNISKNMSQKGDSHNKRVVNFYMFIFFFFFQIGLHHQPLA